MGEERAVRAIELLHPDGSRNRYEADRERASFVMVTSRSERIRVSSHEIAMAVREQLDRMAFDA